MNVIYLQNNMQLIKENGYISVYLFGKITKIYCKIKTHLGGSDGKESVCNAEDTGLIPEMERSPGEGNDNPLHYTCLENSTDRGIWWGTVRRVKRVGHN